MFVDADALVLRPIDRLFDYPEFSAAPNVYEGLGDFRRMNSGVFAARPSAATFAAMLARLDAPGAFWARTDQTFLQAFFPDWHGLPVYDNLLQYVWLEPSRALGLAADPGAALPVREALGPGQSEARPAGAADRALAGVPRRRGDPGPRRAAGAGLMHVLLTGATGSVGRFLGPLWGGGPPGDDAGAPAGGCRLGPRRARAAAAAGGCAGACALAHRAGRLPRRRGRRPGGFRRLNLDGTRRLFDAVGAARIVFLSSRAVYGDHRRGEVLRETDAAAPDSLYGKVKLEAEAALGARGSAVRATGVYGGRPHKWEGLFAAYLRGSLSRRGQRPRFTATTSRRRWCCSWGLACRRGRSTPRTSCSTGTTCWRGWRG